MIRRLAHSGINFEKYEACLQTSLQRNFHASARNLDQLCETWDLLIMGDYEYIMPVPIVKKYGFRLVAMPLFCQQLGIFGPKRDQNVEVQFIQFLLKNYRIVQYAFNVHNFHLPPLTLKKNYTITATEYNILRKKYFKGRRSAVNQAQSLRFGPISFSENEQFIKEHVKGLSRERNVDKFLNYLKFLDGLEVLELYGAFNQEDELLSAGIIITEKRQWSLLGLVNNEKYLANNAASFLTDQILQRCIRDRNFNFMGGSLRGIEVFFKSFGAEMNPYPLIENSKKDLFKIFFKKY